uniref:(northern house mosquito) hypothetical protein n=1 Tax=Culex pipiens TaxID=7175 RepID=A0A8D8B5R6_CULPI
MLLFGVQPGEHQHRRLVESDLHLESVRVLFDIPPLLVEHLQVARDFLDRDPAARDRHVDMLVGHRPDPGQNLVPQRVRVLVGGGQRAEPGHRADLLVQRRQREHPESGRGRGLRRQPYGQERHFFTLFLINFLIDDQLFSSTDFLLEERVFFQLELVDSPRLDANEEYSASASARNDGSKCRKKK